jgi:hypothetical protein
MKRKAKHLPAEAKTANTAKTSKKTGRVIEAAAPHPQPQYGLRYTYDEVRMALEVNGGNAVLASRSLGCQPSTIYRWIDREPDLQLIRKDAGRELVDLAKIALRGRITRGDTAAIIFTLKTLGKDEGFVERTEHTGADGGPVKVMTLATVFQLSAEDKPLDPFE